MGVGALGLTMHPHALDSKSRLLHVCGTWMAYSDVAEAHSQPVYKLYKDHSENASSLLTMHHGLPGTSDSYGRRNT